MVKSSNGTSDVEELPSVSVIPKHDSDHKSLSSSSVSGESDLRYGCFRFKPKWLQGLNTIAGAVAFISLANGVHSLANGLLGVVLSTLEKQFNFTSSESSWIASSYEIAPVPVLILIGIFSNRIHRPLSCAWGLVSVSIGCILFFIPQFTSPTYDPSGLEPEDALCVINGTRLDPCQAESAESLSYYLPLFIVGRLLVGAGSTPILTVGLTYMDDCSPKEKLSTYAGISAAMSIVGPAIAFICGGLTLILFVDFYTVDMGEIDLEPSDTRWVGAWWLGYIVTAAISLLNALPLFGYPRDLPGAAEIRRNKISEAHTGAHQSSDELEQLKEDDNNISVGTSCSELSRLLKDVLTNPTFLCLSLYGACDNLLVSGFTAFGPKLLEVTFSLSSSLAGLLFGVVLIPAGAGGTILGGLLIEKLKLSCSQVIKLQAFLSVIVTAACISFILTCDPVKFAGVSTTYNYSLTGTASGDGLFYNMTDTCNLDCRCDVVAYEPICSKVDNVQYYSPCHAGCQDMNEDREYFNCSCISNYGSGGGNGPAAVWGSCSEPICWEAILFIVLFFIAVFFIFVCTILSTTASLRCLKRNQSSFAISLQVLVIKLLGTVPGPLLLGWAFDLECQLWADDCGVKGACMSYDVPDLSVVILVICVAVKGLASMVAVLAAVVYKPPKVMESSSLAMSSVSSSSPSPLANVGTFADFKTTSANVDDHDAGIEKATHEDVVHF